MAVITVGSYTLSISGGGSGYSTATGVNVSGGTHPASGLKVDITAVSGAIVAVAVTSTSPGGGYVDGDLVTVSGGTGGVIAVGVTADYSTLNNAIGAASGTTTIRTLANFVHDDTQVNVSKSDISFESHSGDPADCVVETNNTVSYTFKFSSSKTGLSMTGMTVINNKSGGWAMYMHRSAITITECIIDCDGGIGIGYPGNPSIIQRCRFGATTAGTTGIYRSGGAAATHAMTVDSCLFTGWSHYTLQCTTGINTIRNCTIYMPGATTSSSRAIYFNTDQSVVYNTIVYASTESGGNVDDGVYMKSEATNQAKNVISFGDAGENFDLGASVVTANLVSSDGTASSSAVVLPVFVSLGTDFMPDTSGSAYHSGDATYAPSTDLAGNSFDSPPSIGCYEAAAAGGGSPLVAQAPALGMNNPFSLDL